LPAGIESMTILDEILEHKRRDLDAAKQRLSATCMAERARSCRRGLRGFRRALAQGPGPRVIAEIKRRSPSKGEIRADFDPVGCAASYAEAGAAAISVLTEERYFGGCLEFLEAIRAAVEIPLLRKDFVVDPYQIDEARVSGADAVLLIVAALSAEELGRLRSHALSLGLEVLVEVHDEDELEIALAGGADLIGINNRDLRSFETDLAVTERLAPRIPGSALIVAESGIFSHQEIRRLQGAGVHAFLVGESLMREADVGLALRRLRGTS
jgi:indole-3-glycerol phosphate synthase